jgi:GNAT superfamily N-acetyltransferase
MNHLLTQYVKLLVEVGSKNPHNSTLVSPGELDQEGQRRLDGYLDDADKHPEFSGFDLVKGEDRDALRLAILDEEGTVVGFMTPRHERGFWRTGAIYVDPLVQGRGYARRAIDEFFRDASHRPARVWISDRNQSSQRAFTRAGFVQGERHDVGDGPDDRGSNYYLK